MEVAGTEGQGVYVGATKGQGMSVFQAGEDRLSVGYAGLIGLKVAVTGGDSLLVSAAGDAGNDVASNDYTGFFNSVINANGGCARCSLLAFGVNSGGQTLQPGDLVAVQEVQASDLYSTAVLLEVQKAQRGQVYAGRRFGRGDAGAGNLPPTHPVDTSGLLKAISWCWYPKARYRLMAASL